MRGEYDAIVSVEMIEAVGERYWPEYFAALNRLLAPGGRIGLQSITMPHRRMLATRHTHTWVLKYIFPGGLIPSVTAIQDNAARAGLRSLAATTSAPITRRRCGSGGSGSAPPRPGWSGSDSTRCSAGCGSCT